MIEDSYLIILGIIVIVLFIALIILTYKVFELQHEVQHTNQVMKSGETQTKEEDRIEQQKEEKAEPERNIIRDINLTDGSSDINESLKRFTVKYNLDSATLASMDGFSIASSHTDSENEAANLTSRYRENAITEIGDTHIVPLKYRGEDILILFRTTQQITKEQSDMMKKDGGAVLSHWL